MWFKPADLVVLVLATAVVGFVAVQTWQPPRAGDWAEIHGPVEIIRVELSTDRVISLGGRLGESKLVVESGRIRFEGAPCRNRVCLMSGWLSDADDFAACIPNGVTVRIRSEGKGYDSINY